MRFAFEIRIKVVIKTIYLTARRYALRGLHLLLSREKSIPVSESLRTILFIRVDRVGDMVLSTPAFEAIKAAFPRAQLTVMASKVNMSILKYNPHVDEVIVYDRSAILTEKIHFLKGLRRHHFDLAIDPCDDYELETAWIAWMSGATYRIGYAAYGREIFLNGPTPKIEAEKHFIDVTRDLLRFIGVTSDHYHPLIYLDESEQVWATKWLKEKGLQDKMLIAIHPGAHYETQRWPPKYHAELIRLIRDRTKTEVILFGAPADAGLIAKIQDMVQKPVHVSIESDIRRFLALLSRCRMLVCNNSGPLHCAAALHVPTISFMGPTAKERWMPIGDMHHVLRIDDLPCIGCNIGTCKIKTHDCMRLIRPEKVLQIISEKING
ncbi:MAG: glycosyltransferase family 9 protein [Deltaproteobacteria bacterium]|nr:glycosyltransferase family 9 protein [Deltaproteobacteria bacterium]